MSKLLMVRHGLTEYNVLHKFAGSTDIDMNHTGYKQIEKLRDRLEKFKIDSVYSSDLKRAAESTKIVTSGRKLTINSTPNLRELDYGQIEGLSFGEIHHCFPEIARSMENHDRQVSFPGGESFLLLAERIKGFVDEIRRLPPDRHVLIITHGGPLRMLICLLLEADLDLWWHLRIDNASLTIVETYSETAILNLFNDTSHLDSL